MFVRVILVLVVVAALAALGAWVIPDGPLDIALKGVVGIDVMLILIFGFLGLAQWLSPSDRSGT